jgi:uncharacterized protein (DUF488 family)
MGKIYSIGTGNSSLSSFIDKLRKWNIDCLVDLRSEPYSKYVPHFNREGLLVSLKNAEIAYLYFGDKLGGRPPEGFEKYRTSAMFSENVDLLLNQIEGRLAALMCSEFDESKCHRRFIVEEMIKKGINILVIDKDGQAGKHILNASPYRSRFQSAMESKKQLTLVEFKEEDELHE